MLLRGCVVCCVCCKGVVDEGLLGGCAGVEDVVDKKKKRF